MGNLLETHGFEQNHQCLKSPEQIRKEHSQQTTWKNQVSEQPVPLVPQRLLPHSQHGSENQVMPVALAEEPHPRLILSKSSMPHLLDLCSKSHPNRRDKAELGKWGEKRKP